MKFQLDDFEDMFPNAFMTREQLEIITKKDWGILETFTPPSAALLNYGHEQI